MLVNLHYIFVSLSLNFQWFEEKIFTVFSILTKISYFPQSCRLWGFERDLAILWSYSLKAVFFLSFPLTYAYLWLTVFLPSPYHNISSWKVGWDILIVVFSLVAGVLTIRAQNGLTNYWMKEQFQRSKWLAQGQKLVADWDSDSNSLTGWIQCFFYFIICIKLRNWTSKSLLWKRLEWVGEWGKQVIEIKWNKRMHFKL